MDPMVLKTQEWLNKTYKGKNGYIELDLSNDSIKGRTGWTTIYALIRAFQIELGIAQPANNFGAGTKVKFKEKYPNGIQPAGETATHNVYGIIQGALWCKGYSTGHYPGIIGDLDTHFDNLVANAIKKMKTDAGMISPDGVVTLNVMSALLSMDYFVIGYGTGGNNGIRLIQQELNREYENYIGLMPCDGVYGRNTNKALIYALQAEEGLAVGVANGNFGPSTKSKCPTLPDTAGKLSTEKEYRFTRILQHSLYCNGFGSFGANGNYDAATEQEVRDFQAHYGLQVTGISNLGTWMSLLTSCGDTSRPAKAFDCATILTPAKAQTLKKAGYEIGGRYLSGTIGGGISKALTKEEIDIIFAAGLRFFPIYQSSARSESYFTPTQGAFDASEAINAAYSFQIPEGTIIYFAVDFDAMDYQITNSIIPYFQSVYNTAANSPVRKYKVGIYGARNVCTRVCNKGYACSSFVGDMSTGFSGNLGFTIPDNWAFDQFATVTEGTGAGQIEIDKDGYSGRDKGVSCRQYDSLSDGIGSGFCMVNRSGSNVTVYRKKKKIEDIGIWIGEEPFDIIPPNSFFVHKENFKWIGSGDNGGWAPGSELNDPVNRVIFTDSQGNQNEGYVYLGGNLLEGDSVYEEIWRYQQPFVDWAVKPNAESLSSRTDPLTPSETFTQNGNIYHVFTLSASSDYYTSPQGVYAGTLPKGTKVGIQGYETGVQYPWRIYVQKKFVNNEWVNLIDGTDGGSGGFLNLRFDLGNKPTNRLLK